ncbi:MAG: sigma 54-interacting transcriptional regulator [Gracilibacteraceae bacterium]|jgi:PAS domain S-box-containing protein|nr:sigma 54-interacting transcriptional regulator [Gracilibacteraceae bacterium]
MKHSNQAMIQQLDLETIIELSHDVIYITDIQGTVILANRAACQLLQLPIAELVGANIEELIENDYYDYSTAMEAVRTHKVTNGFVKCRGGLIFSTSTPVYDSDNHLRYVITNSRLMSLMEKVVRLKKESYDYRLTEPPKLLIVSNAMRKVIKMADKLAETAVTVLLLGETGTGKDVLARYIHVRCNRNAPFVAVNCASIPESLIESEFFGYEKGAFTGAAAQGKPGLLEMADGGALFLDEIGELSPLMQSKLLRVLETREVTRVGSVRPHEVQFRLICATNRNLEQMMRSGQFREDLYYRINVFPLYLPPLRERPEAIEAFSSYFLNEFNSKYRKQRKLSETLNKALRYHNWPGNLRELRNTIERFVLWGSDFEFSPQNLVRPPDGDLLPDFSENRTLRDFLHDMEHNYIEHVLRICDNNVTLAASKLGVHRSVVYRKIKNKKEI